MNIREEIIECLIINQPYIKAQLEELKVAKEQMLETVSPIFRQDIEDQYDIRIQQWISFYVGEALAIPIENVIIELERIDVREYLNV